MWELTNSSTYIPFLNFKSYSFISTYLTVISLGIYVILGLSPNCYILWLSMKEIIQGQSAEVFVFNTTLAEIIFSGSFVFAILYHFSNCTECELAMNFLGLVVIVGRPLFQSCVCVERYLGVLHPVTFLKLKPMKYRIIISVIGWILIICSCTLVTMNMTGFYKLILPEFLFFFSIKLFTCLMVLKALLRPGPGDVQRNGVNRDKLKAFKIILTVLVSSVVTYGPSTVSLVLYYFIDRETFILTWTIFLCLGLMAGFVQPYLYLKRIGKLPFVKRF